MAVKQFVLIVSMYKQMKKGCIAHGHCPREVSHVHQQRNISAVFSVVFMQNIWIFSSKTVQLLTCCRL